MTRTTNPYAQRAIREFRHRLAKTAGAEEILASIDAFERTGPLPPSVDPLVLAAECGGRCFNVQLNGLPEDGTLPDNNHRPLEFFPVLNWEQDAVFAITVSTNWTPDDLARVEAIMKDWLIVRRDYDEIDRIYRP
jgi:hypothetical protein